MEMKEGEDIKKTKKLIALLSCIFFIAPIPKISLPAFNESNMTIESNHIIKPRYKILEEMEFEIKNKEREKQETLNHYLLNEYMEQIIERYNKQLEKEQLEKEEREKKEAEKLAKENELINRGLNDFYYSKEVLCHVTYYTNSEDSLQGGHKDKKGKELTSHEEPIIALPKDVSYGSYLIFDEPVLGETIYKNVDAGGAIVWINDYEMKVDVFVPNVSYDWIINNLHNKIITATLYYK